MDPEISSMSKISEALEDLDQEARTRVLQWAAAKFSVNVGIVPDTPKSGSTTGDAGTGQVGNNKVLPNSFETFADLFSEASPSNEVDKVLVAGYWSQEIRGKKELASAQLNKNLANLGHKISNINMKFDSLIKQKPQLAIQLRKSGLAKQARKKYKITKAGVDKVNEMINS